MVKYVHEVLDSLKKRFPSYDEKAGYEIVGLVWFQGFNDMIEGGKPVAEYAKNLMCLIKDLRKEFMSPDMKVVVGVMGVNGVRNEGGKQGDIRKQMRSMNDVPEFKGNVKAIETAPLLDCAGDRPADGRLAEQGPRSEEESAHRGREGDDPAGHVEQGFSLQWRRPVLHSAWQSNGRSHAGADGGEEVTQEELMRKSIIQSLIAGTSAVLAVRPAPSLGTDRNGVGRRHQER